MKYLYNIINAETMKLEHKELTCTEAAAELGVSPKAITQLTRTKKPYNGKHLIPVLQEKKPFEEFKEPTSRAIYNEDGKKIMLDLDIEDKWNKTMELGRSWKKERQAG